MLRFKDPRWPITPRRWQPEAYAAAQKHFAAEKPSSAVITAIMGAGKSVLIEELCANVELADNEVVVISTSTVGLVEDLSAGIKRRCGQSRSVGLWYGGRKRLGKIIVTCVPSLGALADVLAANNLVVALWLADEAHRSECSTVLQAQEQLRPQHLLGLSATAFRASDKETLSLFDKKIYGYGVKDAQGDNVVVPWNLVHYDGDSDDCDVACIEMIKTFKGPGLVNATDIADAEEFADKLRSSRIEAKAVHSKLSVWQRRDVLEELHQGKISAVVHVNLLTEGANYPWLCWLQLRREVDSRVRFIQEVGRALRSCNELIWGSIRKTVATFGDPHDLFGSFQLSYAEALGEPPPKAPPSIEFMPPAEISARIHDAEPPVAMAMIESVVRTLVVACDAAHLMGARKTIKKAQRLKPSTALQQAGIKSGVAGIAGIAPEGWQRCLEEICTRPDCVRHGFAADLLLALHGIRSRKTWPPLNEKREIAALPGDVAEPEPEFPAAMGDGGQLEIDFKKVSA